MICQSAIATEVTAVAVSEQVSTFYSGISSILQITTMSSLVLIRDRTQELEIFRDNSE